MEAVESWVELEDQEELVKALATDAEAVLVEKMNDKFSEEPDSDEEEKLNDTGEIESAGGRKLVAPPPYTELSGFFGPLENRWHSRLEIPRQGIFFARQRCRSSPPTRQNQYGMQT